MCPDCGCDLNGTEYICPNCGRVFKLIPKKFEKPAKKPIEEQNELLNKMVNLQAATAAYTMLNVFWN